MRGPSSDRWSQALLAGAVAFSVGQAVQVANGNLAPTAIGWVTFALFALLAALLLPALGRLEPRLQRLIGVLLVAALAWQFSQLFTTPPAVYLRYRPGWHLPYFQHLAFAAVLCGTLLLPRGPVRHLFVAALLLVHLLIGVWLISGSPAPHIDVFVFQRDSANALREGLSPYGITFPNIYGHGNFYGPGVSVNNRLMFGYPYPPLSLLLTTLSQLLAGDVRFAQLLALTLTGGLLAWSGRAGLGALAAALYLFTPRSFFVLEQSWTEPFVVLFLAAMVFVARHRPGWLPYALGLFFAVKQYAILAAPLSLLLLPRPWTLRSVWPVALRAGAVVLAVWLPFFLFEPAGFLRSVVTLQFDQPFRIEALSYLAWLTTPGGQPPVGAGAGFLAAFAMMALALWRAPRTPGGFALGVTAVFLAFFALNKQAFCNYYFFVIGAACVTLAALSPEAEATPADPAAQI